jgi:hypothetical protein
MLAYMVFGWPARILRKNIETIFYEAALCLINMMAIMIQIIDEADSNGSLILGDIMLMIYNLIFLVCMSFTILELVTGAKELYEARLETIREWRHAKVHPQSHTPHHAESAKESTDPIVVHMDEESPISGYRPTQVRKFRSENHHDLTTSRMMLHSERVNNTSFTGKEPKNVWSESQ